MRFHFSRLSANILSANILSANVLSENIVALVSLMIAWSLPVSVLKADEPATADAAPAAQSNQATGQLQERRQDESPSTRLDRPALEARFAKSLSGATLVGHFTVDGADDQAAASPKPEKYTLGEVRKVDDQNWQFQTRIQYGDHDVTVPLTLPIAWADDTPVIIVNGIVVPGLGTYSARVLFHGDRYAGYWQGADHGGHLFGRVVKQGEEGAAAGRQTDAE